MTVGSAHRLRAGLFIGLTLLTVHAQAQPPAFTPGNIVIYRIGEPAGAALAAAGNPAFLDEYAPPTIPGQLATLVQSIALPRVGTPGSPQRPLIASGTAATDGLLTRSADGSCLVVPGYGRDLGGSGSLTTAAIPRIVGRVTATGSIDTTTALGDAAVGGNFRSVASTDCVAFWTAGSVGGVRATTLGSTTSTDLTSTTLADTRAVAIYGGQLFTWNSTVGSRGIGPVGIGTPTSGPQTVTSLTADASSTNTYQFFFADLDGVPGLDTLYIADAGAAALTKFSLNAGSWVAKGTIGTSSDAYRGLAGTVNGTSVTLFATRRTGTVATPGGQLITITDSSGYNGVFSGTPSVIATADTNTVFRGVALAPAITITPSAGVNGHISPSTPVVVAATKTKTFTVTPDAGYSAVVGGTCGGSLAGNTFTTNPATFNCTVIATFTLLPVTITPSAGPNGSISPNAPFTLAVGDTTSFTITPQPGYSFSVGGTCDGVLAGNTFTLNPATTDCTVTATFTLVTYTVTPSAGANGSITPNAAQIVPAGSTASFTVAAAFGYSASVGGTCGGTVSGITYTTNPVTADCTVVATFTPIPTYVVTPLAGANATVTPNAPLTIMSGQSATFTVSPLPGYSVAVRGTCGGVLAGNTFTTNPITHDCTVVVAFAQKLVLFVGNSFTHGRVDPVLRYNAAGVTDLTSDMFLANPTGSNADEPHPWGGIPGIFKKLTEQAGLDYDVSISARSAATLRGHYLNSNPAGWDLRGNIASQKWDAVILQDLSDEPLPAGRGANANLPYFNAYVDKLETWAHVGAPESYTESQLFGGSAAACQSTTGASASACNTVRVVSPANVNARPGAEIFLYETWARPDMIGPHGTNADGQFYTAAEGLEAMTADFHDAYFGRAEANPNIAAVSPVGDAFLRAVQDAIAMRDPYAPEPGKIDLWHTDFFHPSKYGSYLSALVHFATITGLDPMSLGAGEHAAADLGISPDVAAQLQRVARATVMPDTTPPVTTAAVSPSDENGWNNGSVAVTFAAADNAGGWGVSAVSYSLTGAQSGSGSVPAGGAVTISAEGVTTVTYFATDIAGNAEVSRTLVIRIDLTAPTILVPLNSAPPTLGNVATAAFAFGASDAGSGVAGFECSIDGSGFAGCNSGVASYSGLADGAHTFSVRAIDRVGNVDATPVTYTWTVDTTPPTIDPHADVTVTATGAGGAAVTYPPPVTHDIVDGAGTAVCSPASGTQFAVGQTLVTCNAADQAHNAATPTAFHVFVAAAIPPVAHFVAFSRDMTWLRAGATVVTGDVGANDRRLTEHDGDIGADDGDRDDVTVRIGAGATMQQPSSRIVGDTVLLLNKSSVFNVVDNFLLNRKGTVLGSQTSPMAAPFMTLPAFPPVTPGTLNVTVAKNKTVTLGPGDYAAVHVSAGATLVITGGRYQMRSLDLDRSATLLFRAATEIRVKTELDSTAKAKLILDPSVPGLSASQMVIYVEGSNEVCHHLDPDDDGDDVGPTSVHIGAENIVQVNIYAANGTVWLKSKTQATGAFIGVHVIVGVNVRLSLDSAFN